MNRRTFLRVAVGGALVSSSGCLGSFGDPFDERPVTDRSLTILDPEDDDYDRDALADPPRVTFDESTSRVVVTGAFFVGSSSCNRAVLGYADYDSDSDTLDVGLTSGRQAEAGNQCSADESADYYRLVVTFGDVLPKTVEVSEDGDPSAQTTRARNPNATVRKSATTTTE